jgi:hypothetical protein
LDLDLMSVIRKRPEDEARQEHVEGNS